MLYCLTVLTYISPAHTVGLYILGDILVLSLNFGFLFLPAVNTLTA